MVKNMTAEQGRTKEIVLFGLFTALTAIGAFIRIPVPVCPSRCSFSSRRWQG